MSKTKGFSSVNSVLQKFDFKEKKYISREWQDYGCRLAEELGDPKYKSLYIKLAKTVDRMILEKARTFVKDAKDVRSKGRLFMWKVQELKKELKQAEEEEKEK